MQGATSITRTILTTVVQCLAGKSQHVQIVPTAAFLACPTGSVQ
jgi:hypothetical protein